MGDYTGIRVDGIVKKDFRKDFSEIALHGRWEQSSDSVFRKFGKIYRSSFIPCGALCYMPWDDDDPLFKRRYNEDTGEWVFQCSLKNYEGEIQKFFGIIPYFMDKAVVEYFYEYWEESTFYMLIGNKVRECEKHRLNELDGTGERGGKMIDETQITEIVGTLSGRLTFAMKQRMQVIIVRR